MFRKSPKIRLADGEQHKTIEIFFGTRPEYIKLRPVLTAFDDRNIKYKLTYVEQHKSLIPHCNYTNKIIVNNNTDNRLTSIHASIMHGFNYPASDYTIVQGDTSTAAAAALAAFYKGSAVIHIEAGLRTYDNLDPFPEEFNRKVISSAASIHYAPREENQESLIAENVHPDSIEVVGNTSIDNLCKFKYSTTGVNNVVLVTMHRRENLNLLESWFTNIEFLATEYPDLEFVFPMHPNPNIQKYRNIFKTVKVIDPIDHDSLLAGLANCHSVITDSGGIQEEATFFNKKCFVCRKTSERISPNTLMVKTPDDLLIEFMEYKDKDFESQKDYDPFYFGAGNTGELIAEDIYWRVREV